MLNITPKWIFIMFVLSFVVLDVSGIMFAEYMIDFWVFIPFLFIGLALIILGSIAKVKY
jgi:hypothetical protein